MISNGPLRRFEQDYATGLLRGLGRPLLGLAREVPVWPHALRNRRGRGPSAVFLPAYGRHGAALLRIHNIAAALGELGWRCVVLPSTLKLGQRQRLIAAVAPDLVVMQGARHALNRPSLYPDHPVVYDLDDADFHLPHLSDAVCRAMTEVAGVIAGSRYIADWCMGRGAWAEVVWTATPPSPNRTVPHAERPPVIAWAQTRPATYTGEAAWVLEAMQRLSRRLPEVRLRLYDRRAEDASDFVDRYRQAGIQTEWRPWTRYSDYLSSFDDIAIGLAPLCPEAPFNRGKSFGKVLAYLDRRVPVIASDACEHGRFLDSSCGVVSNDMYVWVDRMAWLMGDPQARQVMADRAHARFRARLSLPEAARRTDQVLRRFLDGSR